MNFKLWLKAIRVPFFTATIIPVALGSIIAWHDTGNFMWINFLLTMLGAIFIHAGTNLANDYFDHLSGCDEANSTPTPFSGGSRVIQEGLIPPRQILCVSAVSFIAGGLIGFYLNYLSGGNVVLVLGVIGVFLGVFYTAKPFSIPSLINSGEIFSDFATFLITSVIFLFFADCIRVIIIPNPPCFSPFTKGGERRIYKLFFLISL